LNKFDLSGVLMEYIDFQKEVEEVVDRVSEIRRLL
jgi:hypothetical protein